MTPRLHVHPDLDALSRAVAEDLVGVARDAIARHGRCALVLSGGSTPRRLYGLLGTTYHDQIPWSQVDLYWGDERYVPPDDPRSNFLMAREALLDHLSIPADSVFPMPTGYPDPEQAARAYEATLRRRFPGPWPRFDLVLLGLGADGHTASLFPHSPALDEQQRWVVAVRAPADPPQRLTLTLPVLNHAAHVFFLVAGGDRTTALRRALDGATDMRTCPAAGVRPLDGDVTWWVDAAAAA